MGRPDTNKHVLVTGMRKAGESDYHFKITGRPDSPFPPLVIKMSLHEMQQWLHQMQTAPQLVTRGGRPRLHVVS